MWLTHHLYRTVLRERVFPHFNILFLHNKNVQKIGACASASSSDHPGTRRTRRNHVGACGGEGQQKLLHVFIAILVTQIARTTCSFTIYCYWCHPRCFTQLPTQRSSRQTLEQKLCLNIQVKKRKYLMCYRNMILFIFSNSEEAN